MGNKDFTTATLVATVLATFLYGGGGLVRTVEQVHNNGLWWILIFLLSGCFGPWVIRPLALRMGPFMQHLSMAETIGSVYGRYTRVVVALSNVCVSIISLVTQITVTSKAISMCVDSFDSDMITVLATLILVSYSTLGGIRSVTFTDVIQFMTFSIVIPLLTWYMFRETSIPVCEMVSFLKAQPKFQFSTVFHFDTKLVAMVALLLSGLASYVQPHVMQRVYMSSDPIQTRKVFLYSGVFGLCIRASILLIGLFVFVGAPALSVKEVWSYVMTHVPSIFKEFLAISLLAMSMSTSDSRLNVCAIMVSHDILESVRGTKEIACSYRLQLAKITSLATGLLAMVIAFYCIDLLKLMYWTLDFSVPVTIAPFLLAIFGFRGTSRTALIGMVTGAVSILAWNKWVQPISNINGAFICMLANGLAMLIAHYLFKQPGGTGWVGPDNALIQLQQAHARKQRARKEAIKNGLLHIKDTLAKLQPSHATLTCLGLYVVISNVLTYFIASITDHGCWPITQLLVGVCFLGYSTFVSEKTKPIPDWITSLFWVMGLSFCFPINVLWHWWHGTNLLLTLGLSLAHLVVTLLVLPLYLGISFLVVTLLVAIYFSAVYATKPLILVLSPSGVALLLLFSLGLGLLIFGIFIYLKVKGNRYLDQVTYLKDREKLNRSRKLKESLYDSAMLSGSSSILAQVARKIEESIAFLDSNMPLYKQDFQSIINKLYGWVTYFNKREKAKDHALLQPTKITLDKLIRKVEVALSQEVPDPPRLLVEKTDHPNGACPTYMICDIHQVVYLLVQAVLRVGGKSDNGSPPMVGIQLHKTALQFKQADAIDASHPSSLLFQAIGLMIRNVAASSDALPKVKALYDDVIEAMGRQQKPAAPPSIDLQQETISSIVGAHYGYVAYPPDLTEKAILLVLPVDVTAIRDKMTAKLPIDCLTSETPVTPKEQADSMMALMQFHDYVCKSSHRSDPIDVGTISGLLLLLRQHFGFKRHASGQLFYVRAVGIAQLVIEWVFHSPKVIYAALLYELVRHTCLPLSYIKTHYNLGVYAFVLNVVGIDKRQDLDHPSLLYVQNRLKEAIKEDHVQLSVLFIKLAERLYDLHHAAGYAYLPEVAHMAQEALAIDVQIANTYLGPEIGATLAKAAKQALEICKRNEKEQYKEQDKDS
ncbi:MAG: HD domain-containing protein [Candidatus Cardinium sp.]|uniref:sodium:solute symporter family transporter n=1 Tax=Cardinium endosymbiont of Dermatophagoides farinae TaxID=2597823 RepID=UPI0011842D2C|nr:HD domain-containing protein [Cardinium endosymbiont of Dermatophagoides farinae]TSJ81357.1 HD domain-containing protein [Cardinium endosymbiont of Dermatophagoides farinae]UWW97423.1 MAG: HD domain-containing protein [Candidatus Cardinium sp.]